MMRLGNEGFLPATMQVTKQAPFAGINIQHRSMEPDTAGL